jgi:hypothetical protein
MFEKIMFEKIDLLAYWPAIVPGAILLLAAPLCLSFFRSLKAEIRGLGERAEEAGELAAKLRQLAAEVEHIRVRLSECEPVRNAASGWPLPEPAAVNLNRRGQILRLHRRGKSVPEIASALHVSQGEIELLVKVHDISQNISQNMGSLAISGSRL